MIQKHPLPVKPGDSRLAIVQRISKLMDEQFSVGGFKFGLDPVLNLIPYAGDFGGYIISIALIITMVKHGASGKVVAKMVGNATLDALVGLVPVLGWVFDFTYKANTRNLKLLSEHYTEGKHHGSAKPIIFSIVITAIIVLAVVLFISYKILQWLFHYMNSTMQQPF